MDNPGEILRLCRLCLVKDQVNIPIFAEQGDSREIFLKISSCLPVKVSIEDRLPKKICDGCSEKLNSFYEFWSSSANAEKTLLSWLGEDEVEEKKVQAVPKSLTASATLVKEESAELVDEAHAESIEESTKDESEAPPTKRARRSAAVKAQINLAPDSEDDDLDTTEPLTKMEEESADSDGEEKDPSYTEMPGTSADDEQAGPSGMGKDGVEAPQSQIEVIVDNQEYTLSDAEVSNSIVILVSPNQDTVIQKRPNGVECYFCKRQFENRNTRNEHWLTMHGRQTATGKIGCPVCDKEHLTVAGSILHFRGHLPGKPFRCTKCDKAFFRHSDLMQHVQKHSSDRCICTVCGKSLQDQHSLWGHMRRHRIDRSDALEECKPCGKSYHNLKRHQREWHNDNATKQCQVCGKIFRSVRGLELHLKIHNDEKPYECPYCGKRFLMNGFLKCHLRRHPESGVAPFTCAECGKCFIRKNVFDSHMNLHAGRKPFECDECRMAFSSRKSLMQHKRIKHSIK